MIIRRFAHYLIAAVLGLFVTSSIAGQEPEQGDAIVRPYLHNVVQLTTVFTDGRQEYGFGFVVAEKDDHLYAVTASHVVRQDDPDNVTQHIKARFYEDRGKTVVATLLDVAYKNLDLALLEIPKSAGNYVWIAQYMNPRPKRGEAVWFIGRNQDWWIPTDNLAGVVQETPLRGELPVSIISIQPGTSGAPLISELGIVGMIIEDQEIEAVAIDIATIAQVVRDKWGYPWQLELSQPLPPSHFVPEAQLTAALEQLHQNQQVVDRLLRTLDEKDVALDMLQTEIEHWVERYTELESRLSARADEMPLIAQAKAKLEDGDFAAAEALLQQSLEQHVQQLETARKAAAADAFELAQLNEMQLDYGQALQYYEQAAQLDAKNVLYLNELGFILDMLGHYQKAITYYEQALNIEEKVSGHQPSSDMAVLLDNLGSTWKNLGKYQKAIECYEQALHIEEAIFGRQHHKVATTLNNLGVVWKLVGKYHTAIDFYEEALNIDETTFGHQHPKVAIDLNNLGTAWEDLGEYQTAIDYYKEAQRIDEAIFGLQHPRIAAYLNNLGSVSYKMEEYEKAISYLEEALRIDEAVFGKQHHNIAIAFNNLGSVWQSLEEYQIANEYFEHALAIVQGIYGNQHPYIAGILNNLGMGCWKLENFQKAITYFEEALHIDEAVHGRQHPDVALDLYHIGMTLAALEEYQKAVDYFTEAEQIFVEFLGEEHPNRQTVRENLEWVKGKL